MRVFFVNYWPKKERKKRSNTKPTPLRIRHCSLPLCASRAFNLTLGSAVAFLSAQFPPLSLLSSFLPPWLQAIIMQGMQRAVRTKLSISLCIIGIDRFNHSFSFAHCQLVIGDPACEVAAVYFHKNQHSNLEMRCLEWTTGRKMPRKESKNNFWMD